MSEIRGTEIMAAAGAREIRDGEVVVVGIGLPWIACTLAKRTHAPRLTFLLEIGVINAEPKHTPVGVADPRNFYRATTWSSFRDVMGMNLQRGLVDVGVLGALEIDGFGNLNTTLLKDESGTVRYFNGSAGGNDTASLAKRVIVIMRHSRRKLRQAVAHLTSPGFVGGQGRRESGLRGEGPYRLITDSAVMGFDPESHEATMVSLHPVVRLDDVVRETGFRLHVPKDVPPTPLPNSEEIRLLREEIDPDGIYLGSL
jgi:acyl CoA:acetate/3-ketoacid CoA transferase beta subunit